MRTALVVALALTVGRTDFIPAWLFFNTPSHSFNARSFERHFNKVRFVPVRKL